jgi:hypothetical protein
MKGYKNYLAWPQARCCYKLVYMYHLRYPRKKEMDTYPDVIKSSWMTSSTTTPFSDQPSRFPIDCESGVLLVNIWSPVLSEVMPLGSDENKLACDQPWSLFWSWSCKAEKKRTLETMYSNRTWTYRQNYLETYNFQNHTWIDYRIIFVFKCSFIWTSCIGKIRSFRIPFITDNFWSWNFNKNIFSKGS